MRSSLLTYLALCLITALFCVVPASWADEFDSAGGGEQRKAEADSYLAKINAMEAEAIKARKLFWLGEYKPAYEIFAKLASQRHPSTILYQQEAGMSALAAGDRQRARNHFLEAAALLEGFQGDPEREAKALSLWGAEAEKVYIGDPYERATLYAILALMFMDEGDYGNALAACKSGLIADSDASENLFESDITLLYVLKAKVSQMRGDEEAYVKNLKLAEQSALTTSDQLRDIVSERLDLLELIKKTDEERAELKEARTAAQLKEEVQLLTESIEQKSKAIDARNLLAGFALGKYNTLLVIQHGQSLRKVRAGRELEMVLFAGDPETSASQNNFLLDGKRFSQWKASPLNYDVAYQATTRGGRRMDVILRGKAASRKTTVDVGNVLVQAGNQVGGVVGLAAALIGAAVQGAAAGMTAEADVRCWQTLPRSLEVVPLLLPAGPHKVTRESYQYFGRQVDEVANFDIGQDASRIRVVFLPPAVQGLISTSEVKISDKDKKLAGEGANWLVTPIMGMERFVQVECDAKAEPEVLCLNIKKAMRVVSKTAKKSGFTAAMVSNEDIGALRKENLKRDGHAIQTVFLGISKQANGEKVEYRTRLRYDVVDVPEGKVLFSKDYEMTVPVKEGEGGTNALYEALSEGTVKCLSEFQSQPEQKN